LKIDFQPDRPGDVYRHFADTTLLEKSTGFKPQTAIDQGLDKFLEWFGKQFDSCSDALEHMQDKNWLSTKDKVLV
jgi:nucleoside-diphosphate-sugar epimerase